MSSLAFLSSLQISWLHQHHRYDTSLEYQRLYEARHHRLHPTVNGNPVPIRAQNVHQVRRIASLPATPTVLQTVTRSYEKASRFQIAPSWRQIHYTRDGALQAVELPATAVSCIRLQTEAPKSGLASPRTARIALQVKLVPTGRLLKRHL